MGAPVERPDRELERGIHDLLEVFGQLLLQGRVQRQQRTPQVLLAGAARPGGPPQPRDAPREQRRLPDADGCGELEHALRECVFQVAPSAPGGVAPPTG